MAQQLVLGANTRTEDRSARITADILARLLGQYQAFVHVRFGLPFRPRQSQRLPVALV